MPRLAIVSTHPIQYNAPLFSKLSGYSDIQLKVFYTWSQTQLGGQYDPDFNRNIQWDIPLLEGYEHIFVDNTAKRPGSDRFMGIVNPGLIRALEEWIPDAILVITWAHYSHLQVLRHFHGKVLLLFRGDSTLLDPASGFKRFFRKQLLTWVYRHIDLALYVGQCNRAYYLAHGLNEIRLHRAPHAIDNERFMNLSDSAEAAATVQRRFLGIRDDQIVILFCGKLEPKKDPGCLIRLAALVPSERLNFVYAGEGMLKEALLKDAHADRRFHFLGFQNQQALPVLYRMADIIILPSLYNETWGLVVNEAMACGRPAMVSTQAGCTADLIDEGQTGWAFAPGPKGEQKLAGILQSVIDGTIDLRSMGHKALAKIQPFSIDTIAHAVSQALNLTLPFTSLKKSL